MENSTAIVITLTVFGIGIGLYFLYEKIANPPAAITDSSASTLDTVASYPRLSITDSVASTLDPVAAATRTVEVVIDHHIPKLITSVNDLFYLRVFVFRNDAIACKWLDKYAEFIATDSVVTKFLRLRNPSPERIERVYQYVVNSPAWQGLIDHLSSVETSEEYRNALEAGLHVELDYI